jgi:hypothetical protein
MPLRARSLRVPSLYRGERITVLVQAISELRKPGATATARLVVPRRG